LLRGDGLSLTNPAMTESYRSRLMATTFISNLGSANAAGFNVQIATNPGGGRGGTCFGDSGGPGAAGEDVPSAVELRWRPASDQAASSLVGMTAAWRAARRAGRCR
jgi:hypothetical protein